MPYNFLLLPLIGGFLFLHITHYYRFAAQRLDGYRLLFQSAIAGVALSALARLLIVLAIRAGFGPIIGPSWGVFSPFGYFDASALPLIMGPLIALSINVFLDKAESKDTEIRRHGNVFLNLLNDAEKENRLISVALDTGQWYVGWVVQSPNLDPRELYFQILPFISGYRDKDTLITQPTVFYQDVLTKIGIGTEQLYVTLPLKDVKAAGLFNAEFFSEAYYDNSFQS